MSLRSARERALQTISYEAGGILVATPLYAWAFGASPVDSALLVTALAVAVLVWSPLHNSVFDIADLRLSGRVASDRPHRWRVVHATSHELSSVVITVPIIMWLGGHGFWEAVLVDLGLTITYIAYAYGFHIIYDRLRPVGGAGSGAHSNEPSWERSGRGNRES